MTEMSVLFESEADKKLPQTHVMIIGVSRYDHLPGGVGTLCSSSQEMSQLSSPSISAKALASWFLDENFDNPEKPLGSLYVLLSEEGDRSITLPTGMKATAAEATAANVKKALISWFERCEANKENLAIFYFCGHGFASGSQVSLLLQTFGENPHSPLDDAIDLPKLQVAMEYSTASNVIWFIDACRTDTPLLTGLDQITGFCPIAPNPKRRLGLPPVQPHAYYSSLHGAKSYSRRGMISDFTGALLKGLGGHAAKRKFGEWWVTTSELASVIQQHVSASMSGRDLDQRPEIGKQSLFDIARAKIDPGMADACVTTVEPEFWGSVQLSCLSPDEEVQTARGEDLEAADKRVWEIRLNAAKYSFRATWPTALSKPDSKEDDLFIVPPFQFVTLKG